MNTETGLITDIVAVAVILLSTIFGARRGFALTVVSFAQWFVCIVFGFIFCSPMKELLKDYTQLQPVIHRSILEQIQTSIEESEVYCALPDLFNGWIGDGKSTVSEITAQTVTSALMTVISFFAVVLGIKLLCFIVSRIFSRQYHDGAVGFINGFLGFLFGLARGLILVLLFFALLVPIFGILLPGSASAFTDALQTSRIAGFLYNQNVLLILIRDLFA